MKLTEAAIRKLTLPVGKSELIVFDDDISGFGIRLRGGGSRAWIFQFKIGSKHRRMTFGSYPAINATKAREQAGELHARVRLGQDPAGAKSDERAKASETFESVQKSFLAHQQRRLKPRSYDEIKRHLDLHAKPLHGLTLSKIDRRVVAARLAEIVETSGPVAANRVRSTLSSLFNWAIREGLVQINPASFTNKQEEAARRRTLTDHELRAIWSALPSDGDFADIVRILMLTGQRREEIGALTWGEIDFAKGIITLPPERTKNGRTHSIPMSEPVRKILKKRHVQLGRDLVFGRGGGGFSGWSRCKERLDADLAGVMPLAPWVLHDIRRSVATGMGELGIEPHIIETILNHVSGHRSGVAGVYNLARHENAVRNALVRWAEHLIAVLEGRATNVLALQAS